MVLEKNVKPGTPVSEIFNIQSDKILEIGLTPNRCDAMSHYGVARDLKAFLDHKAIKSNLSLPSINSFSPVNIDKEINVNVEDIDIKLKKKKDIEELDIVENFSLLLDTELSESLLMERLSRELVSYIQKERKNQGLDVTDRIKLTISSEDEFVHETITNFSKYITNETLTLDLITKKESSVNKVYDRFLDIFIERSTNNS